MPIKHAKTSTAGPADAPDHVGGDDWNSAHVVDTGGIPLTTSATAPATPAAGTLQLFAQQGAAGPLPACVTDNGRVFPLQPSLVRTTMTLWLPQWSTATPTTFGNIVGNLIGTLVSNGPDLTSKKLFGALPNFMIASAITAGATARVGTSSSDCTRPFNSTYYGGFRIVARFGCSDAAVVAGARQFVGLTYTTFTSDPSAQLCLVGVGTDSGDANLSIFTNDFTGSATKIPLGAAFPANTLSTDLYELAMYCPRDGSSIAVSVTRINTGDSFSTTLTTEIPQGNTNLFFVFQRGNGPTALQARLAIFCLSIEKEY
jgi:hypothetical protein